MKKVLLAAIIFYFTLIRIDNLFAQLYINGGSLYLDSGSVVNVKGDLLSNANINGTGKVLLNGTVAQNVHMNGSQVPSLEINNTQNISLLSGIKIKDSLKFVNGKIIVGNNDLTISSKTICSGMGAGKFVETNGTGQCYIELSEDINAKECPIGVSGSYRPVFFTTTVTSFSNGKLGARVIAVASPSKPATVSDYLKVYWPISRNGIIGTVNAIGQYIDPTDINGTESSLKGFYHDGTTWYTGYSTSDNITNKVGAEILASIGELYGMNFSQLAKLTIKAYLEGYYNANILTSTLYYLGMSNNTNACDSINIGLWSSNNLNSTAPSLSINAIFQTNGQATVQLPNSAIGNNYYVALKHRNSLETWSSNPILISDSSSYDFTDNLSKAYGNGINPSMKNMGNGKYAIYSGDLNQDGTADILDMQVCENDAFNFSYGYIDSDCNGDGASDALDMQIIENNSILVLFSARP